MKNVLMKKEMIFCCCRSYNTNSKISLWRSFVKRKIKNIYVCSCCFDAGLVSVKLDDHFKQFSSRCMSTSRTKFMQSKIIY